jgi:modulator of FtsH protease
VNPYSTAGWENFFVAEAGASAALAGLVAVALSINLARILTYSSLPGRAAEGLLTLLQVLFLSTFALVPGQPIRALGLEILVLGVLGWAAVFWIQLQAFWTGAQKIWWVVERLLLGQLATLPYLLAGWSVLHGSGGGLYWCVAAVLGSFLQAAVSAWVLLVEIMR